MNKEEILNTFLLANIPEIITQEEFDDVKKAIKDLQQENQELKKQLEKKNKPQIFIDTQDIEERYAEGLYQDYLKEENKKYKNQQKEFIKYLEDESKEIYRDGGLRQNIYKEVLKKYKEIIGE